MNYNQSYFNKYEDKDSDIKDFIIEKKKYNSNKFNNNNTMIIFENKIEELLLKLKFINSNKKLNSLLNSNTNNKIIDIIDIQSSVNESNIIKFNMIDAIDDLIIKLNKNIINQAQIKNKKIIEFEFEF